MTDEPIDLKKLAAEARAEARSDARASRWCWLKHQWSRWSLDDTGYTQTRWCLGCGKTQWRTEAKTCQHLWRTDTSGDVVEKLHGMPIGRFYDQSCKRCNEKRRRTTYT